MNIQLWDQFLTLEAGFIKIQSEKHQLNVNKESDCEVSGEVILLSYADVANDRMRLVTEDK